MRYPRKLQPAQVVRLRQMRREGFRRLYLAKLFGVSKNTVHQILAYSTYKDVK
jgi:DNA invertase Pin-like site-specific DNA recombinase